MTKVRASDADRNCQEIGQILRRCSRVGIEADSSNFVLNAMYLLSLSGLPGVVPFVLVMSLRSVPFVHVRTLWGSFVILRRPPGVLFVLVPTVYSLSLRRLSIVYHLSL